MIRRDKLTPEPPQAHVYTRKHTQNALLCGKKKLFCAHKHITYVRTSVLIVSSRYCVFLTHNGITDHTHNPLNTSQQCNIVQLLQIENCNKTAANISSSSR